MQQEGSFNLAGRKIMIGIPSYDYKVATKWAISFAHFCIEAQKHGVQIQVGNVSGCSVVSRARNLIAYDFLESDCTDLMFIDSDITFNAEDVFRLMAWNSDPVKGIVAGIPVARKKGKVYISTLDVDENRHVQMNPMGLVRALRVATAFMIIRRDVFTTLREAHPEWAYIDDRLQDGKTHSFFDFKSTPEGYVGEDYTFCDRAREAGFEVWIDPTIKLGHMGIHEFEGSFGEDYLYPMLRPLEEDKKVANG
jgi:hypothetical protein